MLTPHQAVLTALTLTLLVALGATVRRNGDPAERRRLAVLWALVAAALAARVLATRITFLHANLHGVSLLDQILAFPHEATFRATYGQYGFFALGAAASVFGRTFEVVAAVNQVVAAVSLGLLAILARRLSGAWLAAWATLACGALFVPVVRVAASEDAHNLAVLLGLTGAFGLDVYAVERRRAPLVAGVAALLLMLDTRQTLYVFAPAAFLLAWARGGRPLRRDPPLLVAGAVVLAGLVLRTLVTTSEPTENTSLMVTFLILTTPSAIGPLLLHHPLLDGVRFGPAIPVLVAAGLSTGARRRGGLGALALAFAGTFVLVLPFGFPTPGVEYAFRSPVLALGLLCAGVGAAGFAAALRPRAGARAEALVLVAVVALSALAFALPGRRDLARVSPEVAEYRFVQAAARDLPRDFTWETLPLVHARPSYRPPTGVLERAGYTIRSVRRGEAAGTPAGPVYFLFGVECGAWSLGELIGEADTQPRDVTRDRLKSIVPVLFGRAPLAQVAEARGPRPECLEIAAHGVPVGPRGAVSDPPSDLPFAVYAPGDMPLQFYRLDP